jgi:hypothetical protein
MYTRKHHKRTVCQGEQPGWKDTFAIDDKGGEIYQMQRTEDRGMVPGGADLSDAEDRGMVPGGADLSGEHE